MSESKFKSLQKNVCDVEEEEIAETEAEAEESDKICPTCIPDSNYTEPDWTLTEEPYLNRKECEYQVKMMINIDADIYYDGSDISTGRFVKLSDSPYSFKGLLKSYIRPAIRTMLRFYDKLETDEVVCAAPPEREAEVCKGIFGLDYEAYLLREDQITDTLVPETFQVVGIDPKITRAFPEIKNINALELYARVKDYTFITNQKILVVHIGVPAFKFDAIPNNPDLGSLDTSIDKIVIKPSEFMVAIDRFKAVMNSYKTFQSYFYHEENGSLYFKETGNPFYVKFYAEERIEKFIKQIDALLSKNDFNFRGFLDTGMVGFNMAYEVEISFDKSDETKPFAVKSVRARKRNCAYAKCSVGLPTFISYSKSDQTMMGYVSDMDNIIATLSSNKTPPWLDFLVGKTYPQLGVNYGSAGNFEEDSCLNLNFNDIADFILNETMNLFKAMEYRYNQNACKTKEELLEEQKKIRDIFSDGNEKELEEFQKAYDAAKREEDKITKALEDGYNNTMKFGKQVLDGKYGFKELGDDLGKGTTGDDIKKFIDGFNFCDFQGSLTGVIKCLSAALTLDEMYYTFLKQIISSAGDAAIETILDTLPGNKRQEIERKIREQFKDMPYPWEPGWEAGSLGEAVDKQVAQEIETNMQTGMLQAAESASIQAEIDRLQLQIQELESGKGKTGYLESLTIEIDDLKKELADNSVRVNELEQKIPLFEQFEQELLDEKQRLLNDFNQIIEEIQGVPSDQADRIAELERFSQQVTTKLNEVEADLDSTQVQLASDRNELVPLKQLEEAIKSAISEKEKTIADVRFGIGDFSQENLQKEIDQMYNEIAELSKKKFQADAIVEENKDYVYFNSLPEEQQQEIIDRQKKRTAIVRTTPSDEIVEGTLGKALGNVQKALTQAYIDEIMKSATIVELQTAIESIPGGDILGKIISRFECGKDPLVYPPIDSFLSTITADPCRTDDAKISLPEIQDVPTNFNWLEQIGDAVYVGLRDLASRVIVAVIVKTTQLLKTDLCDTFGELLKSGILTGEDGGLEAFIASVLCPEPKTKDEKDKLSKRLLEAGGARGKADQSYKDLANLLSVTVTQKEIKQAIVGRATQTFLNNISTLVRNTLPDFADLFADARSTALYFQVMGNFLTQEQRNAIIDELETPLDQYPVDISICLTKEEKDLWDMARQNAFSDPEIGREFVRKQNEKIKSDLASAADLLLNGPTGLLENAINEAFKPRDPDCEVNKGIIPTFNDYPANRKQTISNAITGIFKSLEKAFLDDTIEDNFWEPYNPNGVLIEILADINTFNLAKHMSARNNIFWQFLMQLSGVELEFPPTVAIHLKTYMDSLEVSYKVKEDRPSLSQTVFDQVEGISLDYNNESKFHIEQNENSARLFNSTIVVNETSRLDGTTLIVDRQNGISFTNDNLLDIPEEYETPIGFSELPLGVVTYGKMLESIWSNFDVTLDDEKYVKMFEGMNYYAYNTLRKRLTERQPGTISEGFSFGNQEVPLTEDDMTYVGPNGEEPYEDYFTEEDKVLGRSKSNNPLIHFLDPNKHGGTYLKPRIYIAEPRHTGWLGFSRVVVPNATGCDPKNSNFLMLDELIKKIDKDKIKIPPHKFLSESPECTVELPFDKVATGETLATLEACVRATIRVYLSDFLIRTFPIFSNVHLDVDKNYDNIMLNYITEYMYNGLGGETSLFASTYEGGVYLLLFLEQVVQIVSRRIKDGDMETNQEIEQILGECLELQENYTLLYNRDGLNYNLYTKLGGDLIWDFPEEDLQKFDKIRRGIAIIGEGFDILNTFEDIVFAVVPLPLDKLRFAVKIEALNSVKSTMKKLLKYLVKEELEMYSKKMREELEPRPWIYDIKKFFIGGSGISLGKQINAGVYDAEVPIGGGVGSLPYGNINDCPNADMIHALNNVEISDEKFEEIKEHGGFYLEKYVVCMPKENVGLIKTEDANGLISIPEFKRFLRDNQINLDFERNISDYFGNAELVEGETAYKGTIGIKFGVRLCYIPNVKIGATMNEEAQKNRSFVQEPATFITESGEKTLMNSRYSFPICSFEEDILDVKIGDIFISDENLNLDLKCYIDNLAKTQNFKHLMDNVLQIKKIPSIFMVYSYVNLLPSIGDTSERLYDDTRKDLIENIANPFTDSKARARALFVSYYKNNDRDPPNEELNFDDILAALQQKLLNAISFIDFGEFSWDLRSRIVRENPFDKDGNECKNDFGKLFSKKGE